MAKSKAKPLTDDDIMPIGKQFRGKVKMRDVPAQYLKWLDSQDFIYFSPSLFKYIQINRAIINVEVKHDLHIRRDRGIGGDRSCGALILTDLNLDLDVIIDDDDRFFLEFGCDTAVDILNELQLDTNNLSFISQAKTCHLMCGDLEYIGFKSYEDAEEYAHQEAMCILEDGGCESLIEDYISIPDSEGIADERSEEDILELSEQEIWERADMWDEWNEIDDIEDQEEMEEKKYELLERATAKVRDEIYDDYMDRLSDPIQYIRDRGVAARDIQYLSYVEVDFEKAADDLVSSEGVCGLVSRWDGHEHEINGTYWYRTS